MEETTDLSDTEVHKLVKKLSSFKGKVAPIREVSSQIFDLLKKKKDISEYDYLWTLYILVISAGPELEGGMSVKDYLNITDTTLNYLDYNGVGQWIFTDQGQFKITIYKLAANGAAWALRNTKPKEALAYIELGLDYMNQDDTWLQDTQVQILLNLGEKDTAYAIIKAVLNNYPDFEEFQAFKNDQSYIRWLKTN